MKESNPNRIRILCTSDVHGKIYPHSYADGSYQAYGYARLKTCIDSLRDENTILIDNGDVLVGSPFMQYFMSNFPTDLGKTSPITRVINAMNYDFINLGNHDFDYGVKALFHHIEGTGAKCITENVRYTSNAGSGACSLPKYLNHQRENCYELIEIAGKKLALFGIITHFVPKWEGEEHTKGMTFLDAFDEAKRIVEKIKEDNLADYIVCVYHGGFERDPETGEQIGFDTGENQGYRMLKEIPEIDVLLTGHQHRLFEGNKYTQPGEGGVYLACVDIDLETGTVNPKLIEVETEADEGIMNLVRDDEDACQIWLDKIIGKSKLDLLIHDELDARINKSQLITYVNKVQMDYCGADVSAVALFYGAIGIGPDISMRQLVSTYVFPDNLIVKKINGKILRDYLEKDMEFWIIEDGKIAINPEYMVPYPQHFNYDMLDGVEYTAKISNPVGERIIKLTRNGEPVTDEMELTIAVSNYRAAGGGNFFMLSDAETVWQDSITVVDLMQRDIMEKRVIEFEPVNNIEIIL